MGKFDEDDRINDETGFRFVRALASQKASLDRRLTLADIRVLGALSYFMNTGTRRAWPSYKLLAELTGLAEVSVRRSITSLKENGYIFTERKARRPGERAISHYGLRGIKSEDLDALVTAAVGEIRQRLTASQKERSDIPLTASPAMQSQSDCIISGSADCIIWRPQEPYKKEPKFEGKLVSGARALANEFFSDDQISELHRLHGSWGAPNEAPVETVPRDGFVTRLSTEIEALRCQHRDDVIRPALLRSLNAIRSTKAKDTGGRAMLACFSAIMRTAVAEELADRANIAEQRERRPARARGRAASHPISPYEAAMMAFNLREED